MAGLSKAKLAAMVEDATVDAYGDDEQATGFHAMIENNLKVPFVTKVFGRRGHRRECEHGRRE